eukprot:Clim_evm27s207 gene=Clim_evmTU27s207
MSLSPRAHLQQYTRASSTDENAIGASAERAAYGLFMYGMSSVLLAILLLWPLLPRPVSQSLDIPTELPNWLGRVGNVLILTSVTVPLIYVALSLYLSPAPHHRSSIEDFFNLHRSDVGSQLSGADRPTPMVPPLRDEDIVNIFKHKYELSRTEALHILRG